MSDDGFGEGGIMDPYYLAPRAEEPPPDVEWWTEYRVHPAQTWDQATSIRQESEQEARDWVGRWERGGVVISARVVAKTRRIVAEYTRSEDSTLA